MYEYIDTSGVPWAQMCDKYPREVARWVEATTREWKDDLKPTTAVEKFDAALASEGVVSMDRAGDWPSMECRTAIVKALNLHDSLPPGELLPCPVCGNELGIRQFGMARRIDCTGDDHFIFYPSGDSFRGREQQVINSANSAIRELSNANEG